MSDPNHLVDQSTADQMRAALTSVLSEVGAMYTTGKDFAREQAPIIVQEMVRWELAASAVWAVVGLAAVALARFLFLAACARDNDLCGSQRDAYGICAYIAGGIGCIFFLSNLLDAAYVLCAPRLFIIKEASKLLGLYK